METTTTWTGQGRDILGGSILILAAFAAVVAVLHHPVIRVHDQQEFLAQVPGSAVTDRFVHGALILCAVALLFAFSRFAQRQGLQRPSVLLGLIFYLFGTIAVIGAALIDGFFVPEIAASYLNGPPGTTDNPMELVRFCSIAIQLFTKSSMVAVSLAILVWSIGLFRDGGRPRIMAAAVGVIAMLVQLYILVFGGPVITAHTIVFVVLAQMIWYLVVGWLLITDPFKSA
jgi:hypothetical protein